MMRTITKCLALVALVAIAVPVLAFLFGPVVAIAATPVVLGKGAGFATLGAVGKLGLLSAIGRTVVERPNGSEVTTRALPTPTLAVKNRESNELRAQAQKLLDELGDATKELTLDEVKTKTDALKALDARAAAIAGFTGKDEIERQGGLPKELTPIANGDSEVFENGGRSNWMNNRTNDKNDRRVSRWAGLHERLDRHAVDAKEAFGDVRSMLNAMVKGNPSHQWNDAQLEFLKHNQTLLRTIIGTSGDTSGGEFVLPLTQVAAIFSLQNVQQGLLQRARAYNVPGRTLRIPYLIQTDEAATAVLNRPMAGMIANVGIIGEGSTKAVREPRFGQRLLTVLKYAAITQASDEILMDDFTGELPAEFINAVGQQTLNAINEDMTISGSDSTGVTTPAGALLSGAAYNISNTRQTGGTITTQDLFQMYSKHTHGPNSVWLASRRTVQALFALSLTSSSLVTFLRDIRGLPEMMILGYPVVLTDLLNTLGTAGDLALVNPDFYAFALRQALTVESSREFAFTSDITTYRFIVRGGGIPINTGKYAYKYSGTTNIDEHAPFVFLN